jgi:hypothetical protein
LIILDIFQDKSRKVNGRISAGSQQDLNSTVQYSITAVFLPGGTAFSVYFSLGPLFFPSKFEILKTSALVQFVKNVTLQSMLTINTETGIRTPWHNIKKSLNIVEYGWLDVVEMVEGEGSGLIWTNRPGINQVFPGKLQKLLLLIMFLTRLMRTIFTSTGVVCAVADKLPVPFSANGNYGVPSKFRTVPLSFSRQRKLVAFSSWVAEVNNLRSRSEPFREQKCII